MSVGGVDPDGDLVVVVVSGVQVFIAESRSTADVAAGSELVSELTRHMRAAVTAPAEVVLPPLANTGLPGRVVAMTPHDHGKDLAATMVIKANEAWSTMVSAMWATVPDAAQVPGFPSIQWVVVPAMSGGYAQQWARAQEVLAARKHTRVFAAFDASAIPGVCSLSSRWPALDEKAMPAGIRRRRGESLSVPSLVKRARSGGFPSTWSIASGPLRYDLLRLASRPGAVATAVVELQAKVDALSRFGLRFGGGSLPGLSAPEAGEARWLARVEGACLSPDTWSADSLIREYNIQPSDPEDFDGAVNRCNNALRSLLEAAELPAPTPYLAVVVQDADHMGERLRTVPANLAQLGLRAWHGRVSGTLLGAADAQRAALETGWADEMPHLGRLVYAGGDDATGFVPVRTSLSAAVALNRAFVDMVRGDGVLPSASASTALVFFHASSPLQSAMATAQELLKAAKNNGRPGFGVSVLRRGGERVRVLRPWNLGAALPAVPDAPSALAVVVAAMRAGVSGRLVADLEREHDAAASLSADGRARELRRLVLRHGGDAVTAYRVADALLGLESSTGAESGAAGDRSASRWAAVARFVAAEGDR